MGAIGSRVVAFAAVLALFAAILLTHAMLPLGTLRLGLTYALAALQVAVVVLGFMRLADAPTLARVAAIGTGAWLAILFGFMALDYLHR